MNKKINLTKSAILLFIFNIICILSTIFFRNYYLKREYLSILILIELIINIIFIIVGVVFNILFIKDEKKYDNKKTIIITTILFIIFIIINTILIYGLNSIFNSRYNNMNSKVMSYCDTYGCDKYETKTKTSYEEFIIKKEYFDYDNNPNSLVIVTKYDEEKVLSVEADVYSDNNMFSTTLVKDSIKDYFYNFNYEINENLIKEAFDKRFESAVKENNATYKVTEIYEKKELTKLKTSIKLNLN